MKRTFTFLLLLTLTFGMSRAQQSDIAHSLPELHQPRLVVGLVVDQMRWDYLTRYAHRYTDGGFVRLMREGYNCNRTQINYLPAITAVGHTSVYTGSVPAFTGIIGNSFCIDHRRTYCTTDTTVRAIGARTTSGQPDPTAWAGQHSPHNLMVTTMTDQLRLATNFRAKTIGIALKDRAAILPAGHAATAAYWLDANSTDFITSSYYMDDLPQWVKEFNAQRLGERYADEHLAMRNRRIKGGPWQLLHDETTYVQSAPKGQPWEGSIGTSLKLSPWGMTYTIDMACAAIAGEGLGHNPDGVPDFLAVSISSTDMIGHAVSPNSIWMEDTYLRLDLEVERLLNYLDTHVGRGNYLFFLTADHAGAHNPHFRRDRRIPGDTWKGDHVADSLCRDLQSAFPSLPARAATIDNMQVHFADATRADARFADIMQFTLQWLSHHADVAYAFPADRVPDCVPEPVRTYAINGYCPRRSGDIQLIYRSGLTEDYARVADMRKPGYVYRGTTHEVWSPDDTHIPLIFFGWNVPHGWDNRTHYITDIAATVTALLNIQQPNACVGNAIDFR